MKRMAHSRWVGLARWALAGQIVLNIALILAGLSMALFVSRRILFFVVLLPLVFVPFSYARLRLHAAVTRHAGWFAALAWTVLGFVCDAVMAAQLIAARETSGLALLQAPGITWVGAVWFSAHVLLLAAYGITGLVRRLTRPVRRGVTRRLRPAAAADAYMVSRRELLQKVSLAGAALPFGVSVSSVPLSYDFRVERREIVLPHWPRSLDGLRVVHLSDIHVGGEMNAQRLARVAALTNECNPDLVLHTGDFLTHRFGDFDRPLYAALARIEAKYGQWACFGNHDFDNPGRLAQRLRGSGVETLRDRMVELTVRGEPLEVGGIDFIFGVTHRATSYERIIGAWKERSAPRLLLNHDPTAFYDLPSGCADLVLSGHTHGGHIGLQLTPARAVTVVGLAGLPDQGIFRRDDMQMYVTRCVGFYGYPMRIGIPPEIAFLVLRSPAAV